jgi:integrase
MLQGVRSPSANRFDPIEAAPATPTTSTWATAPGSNREPQPSSAPITWCPCRRQRGKHSKGLVGQFVFPSRRGDTGYPTELKGDWKQLCKAANIAGLRIHDLRHSYASQLDLDEKEIRKRRISRARLKREGRAWLASRIQAHKASPPRRRHTRVAS